MFSYFHPKASCESKYFVFLVTVEIRREWPRWISAVFFFFLFSRWVTIFSTLLTSVPLLWQIGLGECTAFSDFHFIPSFILHFSCFPGNIFHLCSISVVFLHKVASDGCDIGIYLFAQYRIQDIGIYLFTQYRIQDLFTQYPIQGIYIGFIYPIQGECLTSTAH